MDEYLVYKLIQPETGTEGHSYYAYYRIIEANNEEDAIIKYCEIDGREVSKSKDGRFFDYSEIVANKMPSMIFGHISRLDIITNIQ